ncbi:MAG: Ig-like domain-containing protein [Flavobacteriales bacterium]|nr:Ig-like domain-containing protein [Flavobacteriales bacterium]
MSLIRNKISQLRFMNFLPMALLLFIAGTSLAQNNPPVAFDDENFTYEDTSVSGDVSENDSDPENQSLTYSLLVGTNDGVITINPDGTYTYVPSLDEYGIEYITYQVCDTEGLCDTSELLIAVFFVNDLPICVDDIVIVEMGAVASGNVMANDVEYDNEPLDFEMLVDADHGTVLLNINGTFTYTADPGYIGPDDFLVMGCDPCIACDVSTVYVTVVPTNDPPVANNDYKFLNEDTNANGNVSTNDSDPENDVLTFNVIATSQHGTLIMQPNGMYAFTPFLHYSGSDIAWYQVCDPTGHCDQAQITFEIAEVNDPPVAVNDVYTGNEDAIIYGNVVDNDIEVEDEVLVIELMENVEHGTLSISNDGSFSYTPELDWLGTDEFSYLVIDPCGAGDFGIATIIINNVNDVPVANDDSKILDEDNVSNGTVSSNDSDADNELLTYSILLWPQHGEIIFNDNGTYMYSPDANYSGTDILTYQACDPGSACDQAQLIFTVNEVNDAPVAINDSFYGNEDEILIGNILLNDIDAENGTLTSVVITGPFNGIFVLSDDGDFAYTPTANWFGTVSITYLVTDLQGASAQGVLTIELSSGNDIPVAGDDYKFGNEDEVLSGNISSNDSDADGEIMTFQVTNNVDNGIFILFPDGSYSFMPNTNWFGTDEVTYLAIDPNGASDSATLTMEVAAVNDAPIAVYDEAYTYEDTMVSGDVSTNDTDIENETLQFTLLDVPDEGSIIFNSDGSFTYTPFENEFGIVNLQYLVIDPFGLTDVGTLEIFVSYVNDAPVANNDSQNIGEDQSESGNLAINDYDVDGEMLTYSTIDDADFGEFTLSANGTFTYTPDPDFTGTDVVIYQACDPMMACATATLTLNVGESNDAPLALNDTGEIEEDGILEASVANDYDADGDALTYAINTPPASGDFLLNPDGSYSYTPLPNFHGVVTVIYIVCDVYEACTTGTLTVTVSSVNDLPLATDENFSFPEDTSISGTVSDNVSDEDEEILTIGFTILPGTGLFTFDSEGNYAFIPADNLYGTESASYEVCDAQGECASAIIYFDVQSVNDAPVATEDLLMVLEDNDQSGSVAFNVIDVDLDMLYYTLTLAPANGEIEFSEDGTYQYTPFDNYYGPDQLIYSVCDQDGLCAEGILNIEVTSLNDFPIAQDDNATGQANQWLFGTVATNDVEVDPEPNTFQALSLANNGLFTMNLDGSFSYLPNDSFTGFETISYLVCDSCNACDAAVLYIEIVDVNNAPLAQGSSYEVCQDETLNILLNSLISDPDESDIYLHITQALASSGSVEIFDPTNSLTYQPNAGYSGVVVVDYTVCDNGEPQLCATGEINIVIAPTAIPVIEAVSISEVLCHGDETGSIDIQISNAGDEYEIEWSNALDTEDIFDLQAGEYILEVTSLMDCSMPASETFVITEPNAALSIEGLVADNINDTPGGSSPYNVAGGTEPYSYLWTDLNDETISTEQQLTLEQVADAGVYTLAITDANGCTLSQTITVTDLDELQMENFISIYPNPVNDLLHISIPDYADLSARVFDATGRLLIEKQNVFALNLESLSSGMYVLEIRIGTRASGTFVNFIKE